MTIVMIGQKGLPARSGGIERHVSLLASGLVSRGMRVVVFGRRWYVGDAPAPAGIERRITRGIHTKHLDAITHSFTALWAARREHPDVVHIHGSGIALLTPVARLFHPRAKVVVTIHSPDYLLSKWNGFAKQMFRVGEWLACHAAHRTIAVSQTLVKYCLEAYGCQATYITHPFIGAKSPVSSEQLKPHGLKSEGYLLLVARLIPDKQAHVLIAAYAHACRQRPDLFGSIPLVIVGSGAWTDGYVYRLHELAATIPNVKMLGERTGEELATLQAHALAHVFPTRSEGLAFSLLEAGAYARPLVVTSLPQNREATGGHAVEVAISHVTDLALGLIDVVGRTPEQRVEMGEKIRSHVARTFNYQERIDDYARLYGELVHETSELATPHGLLEFYKHQA